MKKIIAISAIVAALISCNSNNNRSEADNTGKDPAEVHPPSEAIHDYLTVSVSCPALSFFIDGSRSSTG